MANPTLSQLRQIRHYVPAEWTPEARFNNSAVYLAFAEYGTVYSTALALSRLKLALSVENPDTFSISGEYSQSNASGIAALRAQINALQALVDVETVEANSAVISYKMERIGGPKR